MARRCGCHPGCVPVFCFWIGCDMCLGMHGTLVISTTIRVNHPTVCPVGVAWCLRGDKLHYSEYGLAARAERGTGTGKARGNIYN
eukprot:5760350-Prymnesium_polylepis.2